MRNVWRGLAIGAFVGALIGILLDLGNRTKRAVSEGYEHTRVAVREHGPEVAAAVKDAAAQAAEQLREADIPARVKVLASHAADQVRDADLPGKAREVADAAAERAQDLRDR